MYGYGDTIAVDYPTITRDLIAFFEDAKKESNRRYADGESIDYSELWDTQIARVKAGIQLAQDPATLKYNVEFTADRMNKHGKKSAPDTYKKFTAYVTALNKHLKDLIDSGAVNPEDQAALEALYEGSDKAKDMLDKPFYKQKMFWVVTGTIVGLAVMSAFAGDE